MSFVTSLFGSKSGSKGGAGINYSAERANIQNPISDYQVQGAYRDANSGVNQQQGFINALRSQNGIGNQNAVFAQQQALANQLQGVANGTGPNPALNQLNQTTGNNIAAQSALMASQRGASANAGLMARQAAMQGANTQQQAVGQAATLQSQQQLAGLSALQQQQGMMGNMAGTQVGQQANAIMGYNQVAQNEQQRQLDAIAQNNNANVTMQSNINNANASISGITAQGQQAMFGGAMNAVGSSIMPKMGAKGGMAQTLPKYFDEGGEADDAPPPQAQQSIASANVNPGEMFHQPSLMAPYQAPAAPQINGPQSQGGQFLQSGGGGQAQAGSTSSSPNSASGALYSGMSNLGSALGPGKFLENVGRMGKDVMNMIGGMGGKAGGAAAMMQKGGIAINGEMLASKGKVVPGAAKVKGNSLKNDTIPAMLSPKEIVIPRSITMSKNAPNLARDFVAKVLAKNGMGGR